MSLKFALAALAAGLAFSGAAHAKDVFSAKLEAPVAQKQEVIVAAALWTCEGDTCATAKKAKPSVKACRGLAKEVGRLASYGSERAQLSSEDLAACNAWAKAPKVQTASN